jgi:hypothetical protein
MKLYRETDIEYSFESRSIWVFKDELDKRYQGPIIKWRDKLSKETRYFAGTEMNFQTETINELVKNEITDGGYGSLVYDTLKEDYVINLPEPEDHGWEISQKDKKKGFTFRYFIETQKGKIYEISKTKHKEYEKSEAVYKLGMHIVKIKQYLDHAHVETNLLNIKEAEKSIKNITNVIGCMDTLQQKVSQYTSGDVYMIDEDSTDYIGYFNVLPVVGIFTGRYYTEESKALIPVDWNTDTYIPENLVPK